MENPIASAKSSSHLSESLRVVPNSEAAAAAEQQETSEPANEEAAESSTALLLLQTLGMGMCVPKV
jgi:hypothetical protein